MSQNSQIINLCQKGMQSESKGDFETARKLYIQAWDSSSNNYQYSIAAHFVARQQNNQKDVLYWNKESLRFAKKTEYDKVKDFYPSLYFCVGRSYEILEDYSKAKKYFDLATECVGVLNSDAYGNNLKQDIGDAVERIREKYGIRSTKR